MSTEYIILIVLSSLTCLSSLVSPIITAGIEFTRRIERSSCLGGNIQLTHINDLKEDLEKTKSVHEIKLNDQSEQIQKLMNLLSEKSNDV